MVEVLALNVRPVVVAVFHIVELEVVVFKVQVPEPMVMVRVLELLEAKRPVVTLKLAASKVPAVTVKVLADANVRALPSVTVPPLASIVTGPDTETPLVVTVLVALIVMVPEELQVVVADKVNEPAQFNVGVVPVANVNDDPVVVILLQANAPVMVIVPDPELALKNTSSAVVGTEAPVDPPDVADQLAVEEVFQVPVPPTQYLSAMIYS
jgi:hypothetical protein